VSLREPQLREVSPVADQLPDPTTLVDVDLLIGAYYQRKLNP